MSIFLPSRHFTACSLYLLHQQDKLSAQQDKHRALLDSFDEDLDRLRLTPLHSSLINTVGGGEEVYSIAHTGQSMMTVSTSTTQGMSTSPLSPAFMSMRVRGYSMGEEDNVSRLSVSTAQGTGAVAGVGTGVGGGTSPGVRSTTPTMQSAPQVSQQQQRKRDSFTGPSGSLVPGSLEVGSFEEAYPFQTGEITVGREDYADRTERVTLLDCVPSEKEKAWATQCGEVHRKVDEKLSQLLLVFRQVSAGLNNIAVMPFDAPVFQLVFKSLESDLQLQKSAMSKLREDYQFVYDTLSLRASMLSAPAGGSTSGGGGAACSKNAQYSDRQDDGSVFASANLSEKSNTQSSTCSQAPLPLTPTPTLTPSNSARTDMSSSAQSDSVIITGSEKTKDTSTLQAHTPEASPVTSAPPRAETVDEDGDVMALLKSLESRRKNQESEVISQMVSRCEAMIALKDTVAAKKAELVGTVFGTMRAIASVQTDIQFKLKKGLELMKKWHQGHNKYFIHLEHVAKLPESYTGFLKEIRRRKSFNKIYESKIISLSNEVAALRVAETAAREEFMRSHGGHLPPIFFHMVPSLKDKPPYFDPRLTEAQWLPDVDSGPIDLDTAVSASASGEENVSLGLDIEGRDRDSTDDASEQKGIAAPSAIDHVPCDATRTETSIPPSTPVTALSNQKPPPSATEGATDPLPHSAPFTTADSRCIELQAQNALLLERVRELTAFREAHSDRAVGTDVAHTHTAAVTTTREVRIGSAWTAKHDGLSAPENRTPADTFSGLIGTSQRTDPGPVLDSSQAISELSEVASSAHTAAELTDTHCPPPNPTELHTTDSSDAAQTIALIARLRTIKKFLDSAAIKSLLDPADQSPETPERSDSAWSALGASSQTVSKAEKGEATGTSGDGTGTDSAGGDEGPGPSGDPLEVRSSCNGHQSQSNSIIAYTLTNH
jgi:Autophagy protein ATG17-like domain